MARYGRYGKRHFRAFALQKDAGMVSGNMKALCLGLMVFSVFVARSETVPARLISLSPVIFPAVDRTGFSDQMMSVSAFSNPNNVNNELGLATSDHGFSHEGFFLLEDPILFETFPIAFVLDVPAFTDGNTNGIHDFYDSDAAIENVVTTGLHQDASGGATGFSATWNRAAGDSSGTAVLDLPFLGRRFTHGMSLLQYKGAFDFVRDGTNLDGTVAVTNVAVADERIAGPFAARIVNTNTIAYNGGTWTGPGDFAFRFAAADTLDRIESSLVAFLSFEDGLPATIEPDFLDWVLVISSQDADGNGVLDILETTKLPIAQPRLSAEKSPEGLRVTIAAAPGTICTLQSSAEANATVWSRERIVTLTSDQVSITVPTTEARRFFRALVE